MASRRRPSSSLLDGAGTLLAFWGRGWGLPGLQPSVAVLREEGASCTPCCRLEWDFWAMAPLLSRDVPCCPLELAPHGLAAGGSGVMTAACPGCARCERAEPRSTVRSSRSPLLVRWPWPGCASALCSSAQRHRLQLAKHGPGAVQCEEPKGRLWGWGGVCGDTWPLSLCWSHRENSGALCCAPLLRCRLRGARGVPGGFQGAEIFLAPGEEAGASSGGRGCHGGHVCCGQMVAAFPRHEPIEAQRFASHLGTGLGTELGDMGQERAPHLRARCPQRGHFRRQ